ncbi:hypothetical protein [Streptomyces sp. NPDC058985]|uniref:hypothetical protein n=1 Tax=Streptomyces sp. NPDC058985 TaxID=3346684 RepID=UPI0036CD1EDC
MSPARPRTRRDRGHGATADTAREGVANALDAAHRAGPHTRAVADAPRESFVDGRRQAMWAGVAVMAVLFFYVLARGPRHPGPAPADGPEPADATTDS